MPGKDLLKELEEIVADAIGRTDKKPQKDATRNPRPNQAPSQESQPRQTIIVNTGGIETFSAQDMFRMFYEQLIVFNSTNSISFPAAVRMPFFLFLSHSKETIELKLSGTISHDIVMMSRMPEAFKRLIQTFKLTEHMKFEAEFYKSCDMAKILSGANSGTALMEAFYNINTKQMLATSYSMIQDYTASIIDTAKLCPVIQKAYPKINIIEHENKLGSFNAKVYAPSQTAVMTAHLGAIDTYIQYYVSKMHNK